MFEGIGRINDYAARRNLKIEANYRKKTGQNLREMLKSNVDSYSSSAKKTNKKNSMHDVLRQQSIKQKLQQGKRLSTEEMNYLKENDQTTYQKAKKAQEAREELEKKLKQAKTKNEARQMMMQAQMNAVIREQIESKGGGAAANVAAGGANAAASMSADAGTSVAQNEGGAASLSVSAKAESATLESAAAQTAPEQSGESLAAADIATKAVGADGGATAAADSSDKSANEAENEKKFDAVKKGNRSYSPQEIDKMLEAAQNAKAPEVDDTIVVIFSALADSWREFVHSDAFKELPEDETERGKEQDEERIVGPRRKKRIAASDEVLADVAQIYRNTASMKKI